MKHPLLLTFAVIPTLLLACDHPAHEEMATADDDHGHEAHVDDDHDDGEEHDDDHDDDGDHVEVPVGVLDIDGMSIQLAQGHGGVAPGKESHLIVMLPKSEQQDVTVRAWIGTEDRTLSRVGKADYDASEGHHDIHATAPDPLPTNVQWWIEIERADGTRALGSIVPLFE